jgi:hypothetical protein
VYEAFVVSIICRDFGILLMSSLTIFKSAAEKALQGHSKPLAILHQGTYRAILTRKFDNGSDFALLSSDVAKFLQIYFNFYLLIQIFGFGVSKSISQTKAMFLHSKCF